MLVEVSYCGICGSDLHMVARGLGPPGTSAVTRRPGVVAAVGDGVTAGASGDAVVIGPSPRCGACDPCRAGRPALCEDAHGPTEDHSWQGAFADLHAPGRSRALPHSSEPARSAHAALTEPLAVALHGITLSGVQPGERCSSPAPAHRPAEHRRAARPRHRRRHRQRADRAPRARLALAVGANPARHSRRAGHARLPDAPRRRRRRRGVRVLRAPQRHGGRPGPARAHGPARARRRGHRGGRASTPTASCSTSSSSPALHLRRRRLRRGLELLATGRTCRSTCSSSRARSRSKACSTPCSGLAAGEVAAKVIVVPG